MMSKGKGMRKHIMFSVSKMIKNLPIALLSIVANVGLQNLQVIYHCCTYAVASRKNSNES